MLLDILFFAILLAARAIVIFFTFPRVLRNVQDLFVDLAADFLLYVEDTVEEWKDLFKTLREGRKK